MKENIVYLETPVEENKRSLKVVALGHVDDGKSTLIGRLLYETDNFHEGKYEELKSYSEKRGMPLEWAFALDAFQAERDQAITIDTTQVILKKQNIILIDAPGHVEFLRNMLSGAAAADAACLLIDASLGLREQTQRHSYLLTLLNIKQVCIIVNKMDLVGYSQDRFEFIKNQVTEYLSTLDLTPSFIIPTSAREGDMVLKRTDRMPWYTGPTVFETLKAFKKIDVATDGPLRLPVQDIYKFDERRILAGSILSGSLSVGDKVLISPQNKTAIIKSLESWNTPPLEDATVGQAVGITLDQQLFIERGDIISHESNPPHLSNVFRATLFWLESSSLEVGQKYKIKLSTREFSATIHSIENVINIEQLTKSPTERLHQNEVGEVIIKCQGLVPLDEYTHLPSTGRFVIHNGSHVVGGGKISLKGYPDQRLAMINKSSNITLEPHSINHAARITRNHHSSGVVWFTGLPGSGKSTLAMEVERRLFLKGYQVYVLDGDNIRNGLNSDLSFIPDDRAENIRRIGEVAALFSDAGFICITSFISPYEADRTRARSACSSNFHEIYIKADISICEQRDPKGLYKKAREGRIENFTGVNAPYEIPTNSDFTIDTSENSLEESVEKLLEYIEKAFALN